MFKDWSQSTEAQLHKEPVRYSSLLKSILKVKKKIAKCVKNPNSVQLRPQIKKKTTQKLYNIITCTHLHMNTNKRVLGPWIAHLSPGTSDDVLLACG